MTQEKRFVIAGPCDVEDGTLYWSNIDGWVFLSTATVFTEGERHDRSLPLDDDARWVELPPESLIDTLGQKLHGLAEMSADMWERALAAYTDVETMSDDAEVLRPAFELIRGLRQVQRETEKLLLLDDHEPRGSTTSARDVHTP